MEKIKEPEKNSSYIQTLWQIHCTNAMLQKLNKGDYEIDPSDNRYIKGYSVNYKKAKGVSCFVPLDIPYNVPTRSLSNLEIPCYFLPERTPLAEGLVLIYTYMMKLRFPSGIQKGLHFIIAPTVHMTKENYVQVVKNMDWHLCTIKASIEMNELVFFDEDLDNVEDFRMIELYWLMEIWYEKATNDMDRLYANDIHTWIALDKPSFQDLLQHEPRAYIVFCALASMNANTPVSYVTQLTYQGEILGELEDAFGWREAEFYDNSMVNTN
ncbi:hypothetical protein Glove_457g82 [Diversispora epigaea]|uniref:Uncharacterized protein n=1 Tax=Diversispora epigaea TaxID=1348612 RepID=A0A397GNX7_9GLOM|nr:hypothetical protein Glove_457g82 [Diversispora epigaea]